MSIENAAAFAKKVLQDESTTVAVQAAIANRTGMEAAQAVSELGKSLGFDFTAEEAATVSQSMNAYAEQLEGGQLKEEQLDAVAGGVTAVQAATGSLVGNLAMIGVGQAGSQIGGSIFGNIAAGIVGSFMNMPNNNSGVPVIQGDRWDQKLTNGVLQGLGSFADTTKQIFSGW